MNNPFYKSNYADAEKRKNQPDRRKKHEATTVLEIKVRNCIYDRLSSIAQKVDPKATVEDVAQAMIEWHVIAYECRGKQTRKE